MNLEINTDLYLPHVYFLYCTFTYSILFFCVHLSFDYFEFVLFTLFKEQYNMIIISILTAPVRCMNLELHLKLILTLILNTMTLLNTSHNNK